MTNDLEFGPFENAPTPEKKKRRGGRPRKTKLPAVTRVAEDLKPPADSALEVVVNLVDLLKHYPKAQREQMIRAVDRLLS